MGLKDLFKLKPSAEEAIRNNGFDISDCAKECLSCTSKFPSSVKFNDDDLSELYGNTLPYGLHVVIPTNRNDWEHNATLNEKTFANRVAMWANSASFPGLGESCKIKLSVSSLSSSDLESDAEYMEGVRGDVLLLPFFVWVRNIHRNIASEALDRVVLDLIKYRDEGLTQFPETSYEAYPEIEIKPEQSKAYVFLCSHKTRDKRCGTTAPIMRKEFELNFREFDLYRDSSDDRGDGVRIAYVNHVGGHKFAANVIIYLRKSGKNIWLARCRPNNVLPIIEECIINDGRVWSDSVRQVQKFKSIEW